MHHKFSQTQLLFQVILPTFSVPQHFESINFIFLEFLLQIQWISKKKIKKSYVPLFSVNSVVFFLLLMVKSQLYPSNDICQNWSNQIICITLFIWCREDNEKDGGKGRRKIQSRLWNSFSQVSSKTINIVVSSIFYSLLISFVELVDLM